MSKSSWLTIRGDLTQEGLSVPVRFLDDGKETHLSHSGDLNIDYLDDKDGAPIIEGDDLGRDLLIEVTCPSMSWNKRKALAYNIDFEWN